MSNVIFFCYSPVNNALSRDTLSTNDTKQNGNFDD